MVTLCDGFSVIDEQPEVLEAEKAVRHTIRVELSFRGVNIGYKSYEPVLKEMGEQAG